MLRNDTLTFVIFLTSFGSSKKKYDKTNKDISMVIAPRSLLLALLIKILSWSVSLLSDIFYLLKNF